MTIYSIQKKRETEIFARKAGTERPQKEQMFFSQREELIQIRSRPNF